MATATAPQQGQFTPVFTGNNVAIIARGKPIGVVQTLTISRAVNRRPVYQVSTPLMVDAPVGQASVQVSITNLYVVASTATLLALGIAPSGSLADQLNAVPFHLSVHSLVAIQQSNPLAPPQTAVNASPIWSVENCLYQQDSLQVPQTSALTITLSLIAQDAIDHR